MAPLATTISPLPGMGSSAMSVNLYARHSAQRPLVHAAFGTPSAAGGGTHPAPGVNQCPWGSSAKPWRIAWPAAKSCLVIG